MRSIFRLFASALLALSVSLMARAQVPSFQAYHPLKQNQPLEVNTIFQDGKGFLWFGTDIGLFRFDGIDYLHYQDVDSLADIHVTALAEDSLGRIWIGHRNGKISFLQNGVVHRFEPREGAAVEPVSDILFARDGKLWFSTRNDGLYYYSDDRLFRIDEQEGLPDLFVYDIHQDDRGHIWAGTDGGLARCAPGENGKMQVTVFNGDDGLPDIIVKKIKHLQGDSLILATEDAGLVLFNTRTHSAATLLDIPWVYGSVSDMVVKQNQIWISAPGRGLVVFDRTRARTKLISQFDRQNFRSVNVLLKDLEGNIWAGSRNGLSRTQGDAVEHLESLEPATELNILALAVDRSDRIWFSSREGLFVRSPSHNGTPATVTRKLHNTRFRNEVIISLYADEEGYLWAGLYGNGLLRIHPESGDVKHFYRELRNGNILSITGRGNTLWIATLGGGTAIEKDHGEYTFTNYSSDDGLSSDFIYQVFMDSRRRIWFATDGKGVSMLDDNGFHRFDAGPASGVAYSFAEDFNHDIWVNTQGDGVYKFTDNKFVTVPEIHLRDNDVQTMVSDDLGNLIMMHNFGIDVYDIGRGTMRYWGEEVGIRDKHPNLNAVTRDQYGQIYLGTSKGIIKLSLINDTTRVTPKPAIESVQIYDETIDIAGLPKLQHNENNITLHFLGFWYQNTDHLTYLYKLENYDLEWIETRNRSVTYSRLPPGDYTFKVKVSDTEDFTDARASTVSFSIMPPFWKTATFYVFAVGLFVISAYGLMKFRERKLLEDKLVLEAKVEERTKEIQIKTEEIQAQNEEILAQAEEIQGINENLEMLVKQRTAELEKKNRALEEYAFINAHKLRGPVASILGLLNLLNKSNPQDETKVLCEHLQQSANKLDTVVRSITKAIEKADNKFE